MLEGKRIKLRGWQDSDIPLLIILREDIQTQTQLMSQPRPQSENKLKHWLIQKTESPDCIFFIIVEKNQNTPIGYLQYLGVESINRCVDLGICLHPSRQGQGIGPEAITLSGQYLQEIFGIRKIVLRVLKKNENAIRSYRKNGFQECGFLSEHVFLKGGFHDVVIMEKFLIGTHCP